MRFADRTILLDENKLFEPTRTEPDHLLCRPQQALSKSYVTMTLLRHIRRIVKEAITTRAKMIRHEGQALPLVEVEDYVLKTWNIACMRSRIIAFR